MDERSRGLSRRTLRHMRAEAERDVEVIHDTPKQERFPRARSRPPRPSRHDLEWKDVEPALARPARPWDRPLPRPTMDRSRTHGRGRASPARGLRAAQTQGRGQGTRRSRSMR